MALKDPWIALRREAQPHSRALLDRKKKVRS
jgi:hypothetical protein